MRRLRVRLTQVKVVFIGADDDRGIITMVIGVGVSSWRCIWALTRPAYLVTFGQSRDATTVVIGGSSPLHGGGE